VLVPSDLILIFPEEVNHMRIKMGVLAIGVVALFTIVGIGIGTAMAQERAVLQDIGASGRLGSGVAGSQDNTWMRELLAKPETIYGRLWAKDIPGGKIYVETGGGALVTVRLSEKTNIENLKAVGIGNDVEVQAYRKTRVLGSGANAAEVPEGEPYVIDISVIRAADNPTNLVPQAGYNPDTDRGINSKDSSVSGGVGGQCFQCYEGAPSSYGK
jgi:hypothetical protein